MLSEKEGINEWIRVDQIEENPIPQIITENNKNSFWEINVYGISKQAFLEKILTYLPDYEFDSEKFNKIDDSTYELFTKDGKKITLKIIARDKDIYDTRKTGTISLTDGNIESTYWVVAERVPKEILIDLIKTKELDTGIEKEYDFYSSTFSKPMDDKKISIKIGTYRSDEDKHNIESAEKQFRRHTFKNVMDGYHFVLDHLPHCYNTFTVTTYKDGKEEDCIQVELGGLKKIAVTKEVNGVPVRVTDEFDTPINNEAVINLLAEIHGLKEKQAKMVRQMKKWTQE